MLFSEFGAASRCSIEHRPFSVSRVLVEAQVAHAHNMYTVSLVFLESRSGSAGALVGNGIWTAVLLCFITCEPRSIYMQVQAY